ncbi:MAG: DUF4870 domain-containing protein [Phycisphaera sp.]|nr:DUF4870 domain-containing protein [Phycisphaera sp.]
MDEAAANTASHDGKWFWSQRGATMGPVDLDELRRLASSGSLGPSTWVHDPRSASWKQASTVPEIMEVFPAAASGPPPDAVDGVVYCQRCGAKHPAGAAHCSVCSRPFASAPTSAVPISPRVATAVCRASVLANSFVPFLSIVAPAIVWVIGAQSAEIVREAKGSINCHLTMLLATIAAIVVGMVCLIILIGPVLAVLIGFAVWLYGIVVGILGLVALAQEKPFEYPGAIPFFK